MKILIDGWIVSRDEDGKPIGAENNEQKRLAVSQVCELLLKECEWTEIPGVVLSESDVDKWREFRTMLSDLPRVVEEKLSGLDYPSWIEVDSPPTSHMSAAWLRFDPFVVRQNLVGGGISPTHADSTK